MITFFFLVNCITYNIYLLFLFLSTLSLIVYIYYFSLSNFITYGIFLFNSIIYDIFVNSITYDIQYHFNVDNYTLILKKFLLPFNIIIQYLSFHCFTNTIVQFCQDNLSLVSCQIVIIDVNEFFYFRLKYSFNFLIL